MQSPKGLIFGRRRRTHALTLAAWGLLVLAGCGDQPVTSLSANSAATRSLPPVAEVTTTAVPDAAPSTEPLPAPPTTTIVVSATVPTTTVGIDPPVSRVDGTVRFSPVCPVERVPPDPQCAPRPGPAHVQLLRPGGAVAAEGDAGADGRFSIPVDPGTYDVRAMPATPGPGRGCEVDPAQAAVAPGAVVIVAVSCDTGIR